MSAFTGYIYLGPNKPIVANGGSIPVGDELSIRIYLIENPELTTRFIYQFADTQDHIWNSNDGYWVEAGPTDTILDMLLSLAAAIDSSLGSTGEGMLSILAVDESAIYIELAANTGWEWGEVSTTAALDRLSFEPYLGVSHGGAPYRSSRKGFVGKGYER